MKNYINKWNVCSVQQLNCGVECINIKDSDRLGLNDLALVTKAVFQ